MAKQHPTQSVHERGMYHLPISPDRPHHIRLIRKSCQQGFEAIREETRGKRAVNFWRLTDEAVRNGIQSTTRYRKQANCRKTLSLEPPAPLRQRSGARGGKAAKVTAKLRHTHSHADELRKERQHHHHGARPTPVSTSAAARRRNEDHAYLHSPFPVQSSSTAHMTHHRHHHLTAETFNDLRYVVGCTEYSPTTPIFCDMDPGESAMGWCSIQSAPSYWAGLEISTDLHIGV